MASPGVHRRGRVSHHIGPSPGAWRATTQVRVASYQIHNDRERWQRLIRDAGRNIRLQEYSQRTGVAEKYRDPSSETAFGRTHEKTSAVNRTSGEIPCPA